MCLLASLRLDFLGGAVLSEEEEEESSELEESDVSIKSTVCDSRGLFVVFDLEVT